MPLHDRTNVWALARPAPSLARGRADLRHGDELTCADIGGLRSNTMKVLYDSS
jgi:hypothetical protein